MAYDGPSKPARSDSADMIALIAELVFGLAGVLGMGWLYAGNIPIAIAAFIGYGILIFIEVGVIVATFGIAGCLVLPLNLVIVFVSAFRARDYVRNTGSRGSLVLLIIGILVGLAIICGGLTLVFGGLTAIFSDL